MACITHSPPNEMMCFACAKQMWLKFNNDNDLQKFCSTLKTHTHTLYQATTPNAHKLLSALVPFSSSIASPSSRIWMKMPWQKLYAAMHIQESMPNYNKIPWHRNIVGGTPSSLLSRQQYTDILRGICINDLTVYELECNRRDFPEHTQRGFPLSSLQFRWTSNIVQSQSVCVGWLMCLLFFTSSQWRGVQRRWTLNTHTEPSVDDGKNCNTYSEVFNSKVSSFFLVPLFLSFPLSISKNAS